MDFRLDFIGIGAPKSSTTWMSEVLRHHPRIFMPAEKDLNFFNRFTNFGQPRPWRYLRGCGYYSRFFRNAVPGQLLGELSNQYMHEEEVAERIHFTFPDTKILALLRNPIDRSYSHYWYLREQLNNMEKAPTFEAAIARDPAEYLERGLYFRKLTPYFRHFPADRILILLHDEIHADRLAAVHQLCAFLKVDGSFYDRHPDLLEIKINESRKRRSIVFSRALSFFLTLPDLMEAYRLRWITDGIAAMGLRRIITGLRDMNMTPFRYPTMKEDIRCRLQAYYADDIRRLENLLRRPLGHWK